MKKHLLTCASGIGLAGALCVPAFAQVSPLPENMVLLEHWEFNEAEGTELPNAANSVAGGANFNLNIANSRTSGDGTYIVNRDDASEQISYAEMNNLPGSGSIWVVTDILRWDFGDISPSGPRFTVGFYDEIGPADSTNTGVLTARSDFRPLGGGVGGFATGDGNSIGYQDSQPDGFWEAASTEDSAPLRLVLEYDQDNNTYEVFYSFDQVDYISLGSDVTDPSWGANFLGMNAIVDFPNEGLEVDQIFVAVPEPSTYALIAGLGVLGLVVWRRRRS